GVRENHRSKYECQYAFFVHDSSFSVSIMSMCPECPKRGLLKDKKTRRPTVLRVWNQGQSPYSLSRSERQDARRYTSIQFLGPYYRLRNIPHQHQLIRPPTNRRHQSAARVVLMCSSALLLTHARASGR